MSTLEKTFPSVDRTDRQVLSATAGIIFIALAAQFMTVIMLAASMATGYDIGGGAISDLGLNPTTAPLFNLSLVLTGLLNIAGGILLFRIDGRGPSLVLHLLAGVGAAGAGFVTLATPDVHGLFALAAFVFFNLQIVPTALRLPGAMRVVGAVLAVVGLLYVAIMFVGDSGNPAVFGAIGHGGAERMIVYPPMLWLLVYGGFLLGHSRQRA